MRGASRAVALLLALIARAEADGFNQESGAPDSFDCSMRRLAYDFGRRLLPRQGRFEALYYALDLNSPKCPTPLALSPGPSPEPAGAAGGAATRLPPDALFVDPASGSDAGPGSEAAPLRSLRVALRRVARRAAAPSGRPRAAAKAAPGPVVVLRGGIHFLGAPLLVGPQHSGLTIRAYPGESPVVSGGKKLEGLTWQPYDVKGGRNIYRANVRGQVHEMPGLQLNGVRATRARYPNLPGGIEVSPGYGSMVDGRQAKWTRPRFHRFGEVTHYTDATPEHQRNTTVDGWFQQYMIGTRGLCSVYDPPVSYWCSAHPAGGGAFAFRTPSGMVPQAGALPHSPYADVSEMVINVWRPARWANWMFEVEQYDRVTNNFTFGHGGNQGARGENTGGDFFVENVFEELDHPGEFFFNKTTGDVFLFYNGTGPPPNDLEVVVPLQKVLVNMTGTQWDPVRNVTFEGLTFKATRYTYMGPHGVPSAGDWALDRIGAVILQGTIDVTVRRSAFERLDGNAVMISGFNVYATVHDCDFAYIGGNAIVSWGYTNETEDSGYPYYTPRTNFPQAGVDGTDGNHPLYNRIFGNSAREVGLYEKQSSFYMQAKTSRSYIHGNVFFNGPRAGINFNDGFGGGDDLGKNLVFSTCRESGDHGPFNSWDRQPFLTNNEQGSPSMLMAWRRIHHNFFIDNYSPQEGIDNDDGSAYYESTNNFLVYGANGMKNDFGGHDNHHAHNVYAYVGQVLGLDPTLEGHEDWFFNNTAIVTGQSVGGAMCTGHRTRMGGNRYFTKTGNITLCSAPLAEAQRRGMDPGSTVGLTPSVEAIMRWARRLLFPHGSGVEAEPEPVVLIA